jgi:fatty acid desaturase
VTPAAAPAGQDRTFAGIVSEIKQAHHHAASVLALAAIALLMAGGWHLILHPGWSAELGVLMLAEAMILSGYLAHDCAHLSAFKNRAANNIIGELLSCVSGNGVFSFQDYRLDHLRHHAEQRDLAGLDLRHLLACLPGIARSALLKLEALYIPAVFFLVRFANIRELLATPGVARVRAGFAVIVYLSIYALLWRINPVSLGLYAVAVVIRIHCVRFVDAFQHTYGEQPPRHDARGQRWAYDQAHTFSFPVCNAVPALNLLLLNFGYHNAHHAVPGCPWYLLPRLDAMLHRLGAAPAGPPQRGYRRHRLGLRTLWRAYHAGRVARASNESAGHAYDSRDEFSLAEFNGVLSDHLLG